MRPATTAAGDTCVASSLGGGNLVVTDYQRASGLPVVNSTTGRIGQIVESSSGAVATTAVNIPLDSFRNYYRCVGGTNRAF